MKVNASIAFFAAACFFAAGGAQAATQGTASTTSSTASFTLSGTGPTPPRLVQVLNVSDTSFTNASRAETNGSAVGVTMAFCVVDTYSGSVQMTVSSTNPAFSGNQWALKTADDERIGYFTRVTRADLTNIQDNQNFPGQNTMTFGVPSAAVVASTSSCGSGNLKVHFTLASSMPETLPARTYSDTITLVVTPQ